jgi:hypothetical protein
MQGWWNDFRDWLRQPFSADMSAVQWFLFWGLLIVIAYLWAVVLGHIKRAMD